MPGVDIQADRFLPVMWRCVERGDVSRDHAQFVADGLRDGFTCGIDVSRLKGQKVFKNYKSAIDARPSVTGVGTIVSVAAGSNSSRSISSSQAISDIHAF